MSGPTVVWRRRLQLRDRTVTVVGLCAVVAAMALVIMLATPLDNLALLLVVAASGAAATVLLDDRLRVVAARVVRRVDETRVKQSRHEFHQERVLANLRQEIGVLQSTVGALGHDERAVGRCPQTAESVTPDDSDLPDLNAIGRKYGTDKVGHRYLGHYAEHFSGLRGSRFNLLEIGIYQGASLRMFRDYFPSAQVVGLDIKPVDMSGESRIAIHQGSQADVGVLERINIESGPFRVVIDDGSHRMDHVRKSFEVLFPLLEDGGWYVIEDLSTSYWEKYGGGAPGKDATVISLVKQLVDGINWDSWLPPRDMPGYTDVWVSEMHLYPNICFLRKGMNKGRRDVTRTGAVRFRDV